MALTWGQLKAIAVSAALPDTAPVYIQILVDGTHTPSMAIPGYTAMPGQQVILQKTMDTAVVSAGAIKAG